MYNLSVLNIKGRTLIKKKEHYESLTSTQKNVIDYGFSNSFTKDELKELEEILEHQRINVIDFLKAYNVANDTVRNMLKQGFLTILTKFTVSTHFINSITNSDVLKVIISLFKDDLISNQEIVYGLRHTLKQDGFTPVTIKNFFTLTTSELYSKAIKSTDLQASNHEIIIDIYNNYLALDFKKIADYDYNYYKENDLSLSNVKNIIQNKDKEFLINHCAKIQLKIDDENNNYYIVKKCGLNRNSLNKKYLPSPVSDELYKDTDFMFNYLNNYCKPIIEKVIDFPIIISESYGSLDVKSELDSIYKCDLMFKIDTKTTMNMCLINLLKINKLLCSLKLI